MRSAWESVGVALVVMAILLGLAAAVVQLGGTPPIPDQPLVEASPAAPASTTGSSPVSEAQASETSPADAYGVTPAPVTVTMEFKRAPRSGMLFDLRTGRVLWSRGSTVRRPIASLAKMMTAIVVVERAEADERVLISPRAIATDGSKVGVLPPNREVRLETLLYGLLLPSGNDAAVALAEHVGGSVPEFVALMNERAAQMGLRCSQFSSPHGLQDRGNTACVRDLAVLAREVLARPRLARIVRTRYTALPGLVPHTEKPPNKDDGKGKAEGKELTVWRPGHLHFANHNPLIRMRYPGTTGIKTGYTDAAGRCLVVTATHGRRRLGVVLLHSPDPGGQATRILNRGFGAMARAARIKPTTANVG